MREGRAGLGDRRHRDVAVRAEGGSACARAVPSSVTASSTTSRSARRAPSACASAAPARMIARSWASWLVRRRLDAPCGLACDGMSVEMAGLFGTRM